MNGVSKTKFLLMGGLCLSTTYFRELPLHSIITFPLTNITVSSSLIAYLNLVFSVNLNAPTSFDDLTFSSLSLFSNLGSM